MTKKDIPRCVYCKKEINTSHNLSCPFTKSHYDMVSIEQCAVFREESGR